MKGKGERKLTDLGSRRCISVYVWVDVGRLSKERKKRSAPNVASADQIAAYTVAHSYPLHKTSPAGILALDVHQDTVVTGGNDHQVILFNLTSGKIASTLTGHSKKVHDVAFVGGSQQQQVLSASADKTAKVWADGKAVATVSHAGEVHAVAPHPSHDYFVTASADQTWGFHDVATGVTRASVAAPSALSFARFHPDGVILGTGGADSVVRIWDIKSQQNVHEFKGHGGGAVTSLAFSENGYYFASAADSVVKLWDLRKLVELKTLELEAPVRCVSFDYSGSYFAVSGGDLRYGLMFVVILCCWYLGVRNAFLACRLA